MLLAQRSDIVPDQIDGHLVVSSREVEIKVHVVGTEVRCCPQAGSFSSGCR